MLFKSRSAAVYGIDAHIIDVEVDFAGFKTEQEQFNTVGLPDAAVRESRDRVLSAIKNSGFDIPPTRITINLAPADIKKEGSGFDLPIAIGILGAYGALHIKDISDFLLVGELGLDGSLRAVQGMLPIAVAARKGHPRTGRPAFAEYPEQSRAGILYPTLGRGTFWNRQAHAGTRRPYRRENNHRSDHQGSHRGVYRGAGLPQTDDAGRPI